MEKIRRMRDKVMRDAEEMFSQGMQNVDSHQAGMVCDMIKDLAEAEKCCAEAEYYESVVDSMGDSYGYQPSDRQGYREDYETDRMGYRDSKGRYAKKPRRRMRSGYTEESVENLREIMEGADPARREQLKADLQELMREM